MILSHPKWSGMMELGSGKITRENVVDAGGDLGQSVEVAAVAHCLCKEKEIISFLEIHQQKEHKLAFELIKEQRNRYLRPKPQDKDYTLLNIFHIHDWQHDEHEELTIDLFLAFEKIVDRAGGPNFHCSHLVFLQLIL